MVRFIGVAYNRTPTGAPRPGAVGGEAGEHPGKEHEGGMDLPQGAQPALPHRYRPPRGGLE
jgi:hypothetical protein